MSGPRRPPQPAPLPDDLGWVLLDGDNLLHRVRGVRDEGAVRWLLPRLRTWRPQGVRIVLMLDGHPEPGESFRRQVVTGIESHHSGVVDADTALVRLLHNMPYEDRIRTVLVTDDRGLADRARHQHAFVRRLDWFVGQLASGREAALAPRRRRDGAGAGGSAGGADARVVDAGSAGGKPVAGGADARVVVSGGVGGKPVTVGAGKPPKRAVDSVRDGPSRGAEGDAERPPWKPGRGATKKSGNPRRGHPAG